MSSTERTQSNTFCKLMRKDEVNHGVQFADGLVTDPIPFQTEKKCAPGGIYFCTDNDIFSWINLYDDLAWVRSVTIPVGMPLYDEGNGKWKAPSVVLGQRVPIKEWLANHPHVCLAAIRSGNIYRLNAVPSELRTAALCTAAVELNGIALQFVPAEMRTTELCSVACKQNGYALQFVPEKLCTLELCLAAVQQNRNALVLVPYELRTADVRLAAMNNTDVSYPVLI